MDESHKFKLLIDENLPRGLIATLGSAFPETTHVGIEDLLKVNDKRIWDFALQREYCILTKDQDYKFMSVAFGCPPKIIRLNCGNNTTSYIANLLKRKLEVIEEFLADNDDCYLEIE